jgi:hypothetical protein
VITVLSAVVGLIVGIKALLPSDEKEPGPTGAIRKLALASVQTLGEASSQLVDETACPGIEKRPHYRVSAPPVVTAAIGLGTPLAAGGADPDALKEPAPAPTLPDSREELPPPDEPEEVPPVDRAAPSVEEPPAPVLENDRSKALAKVVETAGVPQERVEQLLWNPPPGAGSEITQEQLATIIANTRLGRPGRDAQNNNVTYARMIVTPQIDAELGQRIDEDNQPLGWLIDASTLLKHLDGRCAYIQWSLYDADTRRRLEDPWLNDRRGTRFIPRRTPDARSAAFYVPMPVEDRDYLLNVALYDADATRLDTARLGVR